MAKPKPKTARRGRGNVPDHVPTEKSRQQVEVMVAGAIDQDGICAVLGIRSKMTLRKHYRREIDVGTPKIHAMVLGAHLKKIQAGDFNAIKWWEQSRMGWRDTLAVQNLDKDGKPANAEVVYRWADPEPATSEAETKP